VSEMSETPSRATTLAVLREQVRMLEIENRELRQRVSVAERSARGAHGALREARKTLMNVAETWCAERGVVAKELLFRMRTKGL
jgi:hypothetical protein